MIELIWLEPILERGLLFSLVVMAMYISSRVISFDDLTVEGTFGLGGALMTALLIAGVSWPLSLIIIIITGGFAGLCTSLLHTQIKLNNLMSGIVVTTALFSINLKIAGPHKTIGAIPTIFSTIPCTKLIIISIITISILLSIMWFLKTEVGFLLYATGQNPKILSSLGKSSSLFIALGLMLSNSCTALSGALFVQYIGYFSIWTSVGMLVTALAGLIFSELLKPGFGIQVIAGALLYQLIIATTFECNIDQDLNKLITALIIVMVIGFQKWWSTR